MAITMFVSLYTTRLILNGLGTVDFGIYNVVGGAIAMLGFINSSMASSTQRFMSYAAGEGKIERQKNIFNISMIIHFFLGIVAIIAFVVVGFFLFDGILSIPENRRYAAIVVYGCLIVSTFFSMISVPYEAVMNAHENMKYFAIVGIFESFLKLIVAFAVLHSSIDKLIYYGILMAAIPFVTLSIMRFYCHCKYEECKISFFKCWDKILAKEMISFAGWGGLSSVAVVLTMQGMSILLNMFGGVAVNAAHSIANQLVGQLMVFSNNMLKALNPILVKSKGAGNNEKMLEFAFSGNKFSFLICSFFAIPFLVETPIVLRLWLNNPPDWAVLFVRLVLVRQMMSQLFVTLDTCINATGKIKNATIINTIIWGFPIVVGYIMYKYGAPIYTIYLLLILMNVMRMANSLYFCKKLCDMNVLDFFVQILIPCFLHTCALLLFLISVCLLIESSVLRLIVIILMSGVLHPILAYIICFDMKERTFICSMFFNIKKRIIKS